MTQATSKLTREEAHAWIDHAFGTACACAHPDSELGKFIARYGTSSKAYLAILEALREPEPVGQLNPQNMPCDCNMSLPPRHRCTRQVLRCVKSVDFAARNGLLLP